jgi:hypothetical protein
MWEKVDILDTAKRFVEKMQQQIEGPYAEKILEQINTIMNGDNNYDKDKLVAQLNVFCAGSSQSCKYFEHRLEERVYKELISRGLYNYGGHSVHTVISDIASLKTMVASFFDSEITPALNKISGRVSNLKNTRD